jgi:hypothetical protein
VTDGLVLHLDAGNPASYPGSGTTWTDLSGNNNNGTLINGPTYSSANGGSIVFDGVNDYGDITGDILLGNDFTVSIIVRFTGNRSDWVRLIGHSNDMNARFWGIWIPTTRNYLLWQSYRSGGQITTPTYVFNSNETYVIDVTSSGSTKFFYINGSLFYSASSGGLIDYTGNNSKIKLGYAGFHQPHLGNIDSFKIYNKTLTIEEVQQNFNATRSRFGI